MMVWEILKIAGLVLAGTLALTLLVVILVLFLPIRYKLQGVGANADAGAKVSIGWLLNLINARADYENKNITYYCKILGIKILTGQLELENLGKKSDANAEGEDGKKASDEKASDEKSGDAKSDNNQTLWDKVKGIWAKIKNIWEKIKTVKYILTAPITERAWSYTKIRLFKLLGHIKPRSMKGRLEFGTGDPANTAIIYGAAGSICPMIDERLMLVPDMEEKNLDMDFSINGRFFLGYVLLLAIQVVTNRDVRRVIGYTKKHL